MDDPSTAEELTQELFVEFHIWLNQQYFGDSLTYYGALALLFTGTVVVAAFVHYLVRIIVVSLIRSIVKRTPTQWDDFLKKRRLFVRLSHLPTPAIFYFSAELYPTMVWEMAIQRFAICYLICTCVLIVSSVLNAASDIYRTYDIARRNPIKGFVQMAKMFVYIVGVLLIVSTILGKSPWGLLAGLGAATAILLMVFKDSILGLVASIQIIVNDLVHIGDWVEMPNYGADGDIIDITLTTIKVQNWDMTITTIPTYALISDSFKNWRGMQEAGGRRIKRSVHIDMNTVKFCTPELLQRFEKFESLKNYIGSKQTEVEEYNQQHSVDTSQLINGRRLTNLGTFRAYLVEYLKQHPTINQKMTLLVRQLAPTENGVPIEIYIFNKDKSWINHEGIQSDIFDHILAVLPEFDLAVFQNPTGKDFSPLVKQPE
jgi:miniconductance mechanosensitive channel